MKTNQLILNQVVTIVLIIASVLILASCDSSPAQKENASSAQSEIKAPSMDINSATFMGKIDVVRQHIKAGSDLNKKDDYGSTPLMSASTFGKTEVALALIEGGADLELTSNDGSTALHTAAFFGRTEIVKALVKKGANKEAINSYGSTPLESVAGPFEAVKPIYDQIGKDLGPFGLKLNYEKLQAARIAIVEILK